MKHPLFIYSVPHVKHGFRIRKKIRVTEQLNYDPKSTHQSGTS